jgi:hypothetical protein
MYCAVLCCTVLQQLMRLMPQRLLCTELLYCLQRDLLVHKLLPGGGAVDTAVSCIVNFPGQCVCCKLAE